MAQLIGSLKSSPCITRHPSNPVLDAARVPFAPALVFNAGVTKYQGRYVMMFRADMGSAKDKTLTYTSSLGLATSGDGVTWEVQPKPCWQSEPDGEMLRYYDPRLTVLDGRCYVCFAADTKHGIRGGVAVTDDFSHFEILSLSTPDNRNMVLFPQRFQGHYVRLERPFPLYGRGLFDLWLSKSPDLKFWGESKMVLDVEHVPFANDKIGPAAPPIKTPKGWLTTFHAVDVDPSRGKNGWEKQWVKRYSAGIMLLDLEDPSKIIGISTEPLLAPEAPYEVEGFRNDVIFPGGMILENNGEVKIYYGGADTVECLATASLGDLLGLCLQPKL